ncbi:DNA mismatch repair protein MutS [Abyssalbus ytuae]|uniref:DNA mismatch repair protein MutS n=1 Tax=Abyssalbus ytuae TaxID=2926907 RepID=A0A9E6ZLV5_9FLAO|nr:DNA mismatch repair protein MutS [Abyssalbus ytuae]UOB18197.1 DNA mismatch repair protein MutS [Abyssalbus ytuae]
MQINIGDKVEIIDDCLKGRVVLIKGDTVVVETNDGFEIEAGIKEVIKINDNNNELHVKSADVFDALVHKNLNEKKKKVSVKREKVIPPMEVDLHIGQLTKSAKGMTNYDMLTLQLETAKRQLEFAIKNRIPKIVFIHGVGEGVLRTELEYLFGRYDNITFYDADFKKYGFGATEVYIFQNP